MTGILDLNSIRDDIDGVRDLLYQGEEITKQDIITLLNAADELYRRVLHVHELVDQAADLTKGPVRR